MRRVAVAAGADRLVEVVVRLPSKWAAESTALMVDAADAKALLGGVERWSGVPGRRRSVAFLLTVMVPLATEPGPVDVRWWIECRHGRREPEQVLRLRVDPGYQRIRRLRRWGDGATLVLRNRTAATWDRAGEWLEARDGRRVRMLENAATPGGVATFAVPHELAQEPLELVSARVARLRPAIVAAG